MGTWDKEIDFKKLTRYKGELFNRGARRGERGISGGGVVSFGWLQSWVLARVFPKTWKCRF